MRILLPQIIFYSSAGIILYVYFGYPLLLWFVSLFVRTKVAKGEITPRVSIVIAAHNEASSIEEKINNSLGLDYPPEQKEIIVVSDGSDDGSVAIANRFSSASLKVIDLPRVGKVRALNTAVAASDGEILVFTDANAILEVRALRELVSNFADPNVGGVCGNQRYSSTNSNVGSGENLYWRYDKFIKRLESRIGSTVAADGSLFAIRSELFEPLMNTAQADDHAISSRVVTAGWRLVFDENAVSYEEPPASDRREFKRKIRVVNHTLGSIFDIPEALNPWRTGFYSVELISHKLLRYLVPFLMLTAFAANTVLAPIHTIYQLSLGAQLFFYTAAAIGYFFRNNPIGQLKVFYAPYYFCLANAAALFGMLGRLRGDRFVIWEPRGESAAVSSRR
jgi:cellulose synthase/poly-beta-1,6-N-acetylglucosamine synthase-like glycosyltransferase